MPYNPFATDDPVAQTLISVRKPPILQVNLTHFEWASDLASEWASADSRKRPRLDRSQTERPRQPDTNGVAKTEHQPATSSSAQPAVREVVRVVDKPVPYEPIGIWGTGPLVDDRVRKLVHFMLMHVNSPNVEIEAKVGQLIEKQQSVRAIELVPVLCETPLREDSNGECKFQSNVDEGYFFRLNEELNKRVSETQGSDEGRVAYTRTHEMDVYYPRRIRQMLRRSLSDKEYRVYKTQSKQRLGDMNILCPNRQYDLRYSASVETDCEKPDSEPELRRTKERMSYKFDCLSIDITVVDMQTSASNSIEKSYEVEVEIASPQQLYDEVTKYRNGDETSKLFNMASRLVETVRLILELE